MQRHPHPINRILNLFGLKVFDNRILMRVPWKSFKQYRYHLGSLKKAPGEYKVVGSIMYEPGEHPAGFIDTQCGFASHHLNRLNPENILDVGS